MGKFSKIGTEKGETMTKPLIEIKNLKVSFLHNLQKTQVVRGVDLKLYPGEILGILGESGSGKTVTSSSILKLYSKEEASIDEGSIFFEGKDLIQMSEKDLNGIRGKKIAYIFQNPAAALNPYKRIGEQLKNIMKTHGISGGYNKVIHRLGEVGIDEPEQVYDMYPHQLSGGQNQRVMIAQALLCEPQVLIADEPTSSIDASLSRKILDLLKSLNHTYRMSIILITHDFDVAKYVCNRINIMYGGVIMEEGATEAIFKEPFHPYTSQLLKCVTSLDRDDSKVHVLNGAPITPQEFANECPFYSRCDKCKDVCKTDMPKLKTHEGRSVRCLFPESEVIL